MAQMRTLGQSLKDAREEKGISIKQVSNAIKIRESLIEALERGDYSSFTSDMHLKSFLRSYSLYLDLNEEMILALYRRERKIDYAGDSTIGKSGGHEKRTFVLSKYISLKLLISGVILLLTVGIIVLFFSQWKALTQEPVLDIMTPSQNDVLANENIVIEGFTGDPGVKVLLDGTEANYIDSKGKWRINAKFTEPGIKRFQIIAQNQFNKRTEKNLDLVYKPEIKVTKQKVKLKNLTKNQVIVGSSKDTSPDENLTIAAEATIEIQFDKEVKVTNFDKNALQLFINDDTSPTSAVDTNRFVVLFENNRPIIKVLENEKPKQTPTQVPTKIPTTAPKTPIPTVSKTR